MSPLRDELTSLGLGQSSPIHAHLSVPLLVEHALRRGEGQLSDRGAFAVRTGERTGRSPLDRFLIVEETEAGLIDWGKINQRMMPDVFHRLLGRVRDYLKDRELFLCDAHVCAEPAQRLNVRVISDTAWHVLLAHRLFRQPVEPGTRTPFTDGLTIISAPGFRADPGRDGTNSEAAIILDLPRRLMLVAGTGYAGEIKKAVFSYLNYLLPARGVFPMHCAANIGRDGKSALFFGLSGTGKTTLSADPERRLIGDDEHGWSDEGIFNIEGGCYAKCIKLSAQREPQIHAALGFGSVLENVVIDTLTRRPDFDDGSITENTRAAYALDAIPDAELGGRGAHPLTIVFLTCDAFGVLPPVSKLSVEQAMYHFLSGYTAKVAGTERGVVGSEATFSTCFAAPFLPLFPARYADLLAERMRRHGSEVWLINTGWTEGTDGGGGRRIPLEATRAMVRAVLAGTLNGVPMRPDPLFRVMVPEGCPGVPSRLLHPRGTWNDPGAYDDQASALARRFLANFQKYQAQVSEAVRQAGPAV